MNRYLQPVLNLLGQRRIDDYLVVLLALSALLVLVQGVRGGAALLSARTALQSLKQINEPPTRQADKAAMAKYEVILAKGILGTPPSKGGPSEMRLFGILGETALMGTSPGGVQPFKSGASLPGGEKLVKVEVSSVVVEKEGKQRTLSVFPEPGKGPSAPGGASMPPGGRPDLRMPGGPGGRPPDGPGAAPPPGMSSPPPGMGAPGNVPTMGTPPTRN